MQHIIAQQPLGVLAILTILLALMFLSAWKAPRWVRPIGSISLALCFLFILYATLVALWDIHITGGVSQSVLAQGLSATNWTIIYGLLIYLISHIIRFIQKPFN